MNEHCRKKKYQKLKQSKNLLFFFWLFLSLQLVLTLLPFFFLDITSWSSGLFLLSSSALPFLFLFLFFFFFWYLLLACHLIVLGQPISVHSNPGLSPPPPSPPVSPFCINSTNLHLQPWPCLIFLLIQHFCQQKNIQSNRWQCILSYRMMSWLLSKTPMGLESKSQ